MTEANKGIVIHQVLAGAQQATFTEKDFTFNATGECTEVESFYVAKTKDGVLVGVVNDGDIARSSIATIVGNYIASGFIVTSVNSKELIKLIKAVKPPVVQVETEKTSESPAPAAESTQSNPAQVDVKSADTAAAAEATAPAADAAPAPAQNESTGASAESGGESNIIKQGDNLIDTGSGEVVNSSQQSFVDPMQQQPLAAAPAASSDFQEF